MARGEMNVYCHCPSISEFEHDREEGRGLMLVVLEEISQGKEEDVIELLRCRTR